MKKNNSRLSYQLFFSYLMTLVVLLVLTSEVFARAGGGGGGGGGGEGLGEVIYFIIMVIPFPYNILVVGLLIFLSWLARRKIRESSVMNKMRETMPASPKGLAAFQSRNPGYNEAAFLQRVRTAFTGVQNAWAAGNMASVRRYISDGVYQRFNTQFKMMKQLDLQNRLEKMEILETKVYSYDRDGEYDVAHVAIAASLVDRFESKKYPELNAGGIEAFSEFWTFIRKTGAGEKNIFDSENCPQCGAELPKDMGDVARCEHCGAITSLGDYDWVLCEITQNDDFLFQNRKLTTYDGSHAGKIRSVVKDIPGFSIQHIEDKVSNGFLQIQTARTLKDPTIMRRFVGDKLYEAMEDTIKNEAPFVYYRIYLSDVTLTGAHRENNTFHLSVAVKMSFQRVLLNNGKLQRQDMSVISDMWNVNLTRELTAEKSKGSLYAHTCPFCGGTVSDTTDVKCPYCGSVLNSPKGEWIITSISEPGYLQSMGEAPDPGGFAVMADAEKLDDMLDVRDFAFNNVAVMVAADNQVTDDEMALMRKLAKKWGYNVNKIEPTIEMAVNKKLSIRMPDNPKKRRRIIDLMEKAAKVDGLISTEEQQLLDSLRAEYLK